MVSRILYPKLNFTNLPLSESIKINYYFFFYQKIIPSPMMFSQAQKDQLTYNFNPPVGHYDIVSKFEGPSFRYNKPLVNPKKVIEEEVKIFERSMADSPLNNYAKPIQRVKQNRIYMKLRQTSHQVLDLQVFIKENKPKQQKGRILKPNRESNPLFNPKIEALYLGGEALDSHQSSKRYYPQHLKKPPKQTQLESLELLLLKEKMTKQPENPGPGSYHLKGSIGEQQRLLYEPFSKQVGRITESNNLNASVGQYNITDTSYKKGTMQFQKYSKRSSIFDKSPILRDSDRAKESDLVFPTAFVYQPIKS